MLENLKPKIKLTSCKVRTVMSTLDDKDRVILQNALDDESTWPAITLMRELNALGIEIGQEVIRRHRSGTCSCSKA